MFKSIALLLFSVLLLSTFAEDCNNPLLTTFGFTFLGTPQVVSDLTYCKSLASSSCCSADTINAFQDKVDDLIAELQATVAQRDQFLVSTRTDSIPDLIDKFREVTYASAKAIAKLISQGEFGSTLTLARNLGNIKDQLDDDLPKFRSDFLEFQQSRVVCVTKMIRTQASAWCLACNPNYNFLGIVSGELVLSSDLKEALLENCFDYLSYADLQSGVLYYRYLYDYLDDIIAALDAIADGDSDGESKLEAATTASDKAGSDVTDVTKRLVSLPTSCTSKKCDWISDDLFVSGEVNKDLLAAGGVGSDGSQRRLLEEGGLRGRMLQAGWNPDDDEAGVEVSFALNPGDVDNSSAGRLEALLVMVVLMIIFI